MLVYKSSFCLDPRKLTIWSEKGEAPIINHMSLGEADLKRWLTIARTPSQEIESLTPDRHRCHAQPKVKKVRKLQQGCD